ncbi:MAG: Rieske 2Fe-2S domain-containing protein [Gemmatimonadaceae bacterium]
MDDISNYESVAVLDDIPDEGVLGVVKSNGERICLIRHGGRVSAVADRCSHQDFEMSLGDVLPDGTIQCAWHGARFDCSTGVVKQGPASDPLPMFDVRIDSGIVLVGMQFASDGVAQSPSEAWISPDGGQR